MQFEWLLAYAKAEMDNDRKRRLSSSQGKRYVVSCIGYAKSIFSN